MPNKKRENNKNKLLSFIEKKHKLINRVIKYATNRKIPRTVNDILFLFTTKEEKNEARKTIESLVSQGFASIEGMYVESRRGHVRGNSGFVPLKNHMHIKGFGNPIFRYKKIVVIEADGRDDKEIPASDGVA